MNWRQRLGSNESAWLRSGSDSTAELRDGVILLIRRWSRQRGVWVTQLSLFGKDYDGWRLMMTGTWGYGGTRCRIKQGWKGAGREGDAISYFEHDRLGQEWTVVLWDDEDDPDCFKSAGLEIKRLGESQFK